MKIFSYKFRLGINPINTGLFCLVVALERGVSTNLIQTTKSIETWRANSLYDVLRNMKIGSQVVRMTSLPKTMAKFRPQ